MENEKYNGWTNRETWATKLWIDNNEETYLEAREVATSGTEGEAAEALKKLVETWTYYDIDQPQDFNCYMAKDIGSMWRVNWLEIVKNYRTEA